MAGVEWEIKNAFYKVHLKDDTISKKKLFDYLEEQWCSRKEASDIINKLLTEGYIKQSGDYLWMNPYWLKEWEKDNLDPFL